MMNEQENATNKIIEILVGLSEKLTGEHAVEPRIVARAYLAAAIELHLRVYDSIPAAAEWLCEMAQELLDQDEGEEIHH